MASQGQAQLNPLTQLITARSYVSTIGLLTPTKGTSGTLVFTTPNTYIQRVHRDLFRTGERTRPAVTCFGPAGGTCRRDLFRTGGRILGMLARIFRQIVPGSSQRERRLDTSKIRCRLFRSTQSGSDVSQGGPVQAAAAWEQAPQVCSGTSCWLCQWFTAYQNGQADNTTASPLTLEHQSLAKLFGHAAGGREKN